MRTSRIIPLLVIAFASSVVVADSPPASNPTPMGDLQAQLDLLAARVESLESNAPSSSVDGRTYCMLSNVTRLRSTVLFGPNAGPEKVESLVIRRVATFVDGTFTATLVSSYQNALNGDGVMEFGPGSSPEVLLGSYLQSGTRLDMTIDANPLDSWYVSKDGSLIHNNGIGLIGPFPNGLSLGLSRSVTFVEGDTCDPALL